MGVTVCLPLFGNPGHELEEGAPASSKDLRALADAMRERLYQAADSLDQLTADGWSGYYAMFDVILTHTQVNTHEQAEERLRAVGIDPAQLLIVEDVEEEEGAD
jgi:hypothetical protein